MSLLVETKALHIGCDTKKKLVSRDDTISQSTSHLLTNSEHAANLFSLAEPEFMYTCLKKAFKPFNF